MSKIGFPKKVLEKNKYVIFAFIHEVMKKRAKTINPKKLFKYKSPKGLKEFYRL